jgi:Cu+-exporting ATPase
VLALQVTRARGESGAASAVLVRLGLAIFFAMNVMMLSLPTYAPHVYGAAGAPAEGTLFQVLRVLAMVFAAPVLLLLGWPILAGALRGMRGGVPNTDALIILGTAAAYGLSVANTVAGRGDVYFDTAAALLVLVTLGRYLEARAKAEAGAAIRTRLAPAPALAARVLLEASEEEIDGLERSGAVEAVPPERLRVGDVVRVRPGDAFPTDGVVLEGRGGADEASLTGESRAVEKEPGSAVAGGTCSIDGSFLVRVTSRAADSAPARIAALLEQARRERAPAERLADRIAAVMVPGVLIVAALAGVYWTLQHGFDHGLLAALAVLVVACPCGLGIATPVAVWTGLVAAARSGVVVRSAPALERAASIVRVLFDKTGTLTERTPRLIAAEPAQGRSVPAGELLALAAALESGLTHPLARATLAAWDDPSGGLLPLGQMPRLDAGSVRVLPGRGVRGTIDGRRIAVGSIRFARRDLAGTDPFLDVVERAQGTAVALWDEEGVLGALRFAETPRREAAASVAALRALGLRVGLLSGDLRADAVVPDILAAEEAALGLLPEDKVARVRAERDPLAMVGDGINDAPALAAADLGIAVGSATDLARVTADVAIVSDDLGRVPWLLAHARRVRRVIVENLFWVFAYNAVAIALAAAGMLSPLVASLVMLASSLLVVANARRLRYDGGVTSDG